MLNREELIFLVIYCPGNAQGELICRGYPAACVRIFRLRWTEALPSLSKKKRAIEARSDAFYY